MEFLSKSLAARPGLEAGAVLCFICVLQDLFLRDLEKKNLLSILESLLQDGASKSMYFCIRTEL